MVSYVASFLSLQRNLKDALLTCFMSHLFQQLFSTAHWKTELYLLFFFGCQQDYLKITELEILQLDEEEHIAK